MNYLKRTVTVLKCVSALFGIVGVIMGPLIFGLYLIKESNNEINGFAVSAMIYAFIIVSMNLYVDFTEKRSW